jgi:20S proteasome alpha/beta subunit
MKISKEDLIKLVSEAFKDGYWTGDEGDVSEDDWRYSNTKEKLEELTGEEYINLDLS